MLLAGCTGFSPAGESPTSPESPTSSESPTPTATSTPTATPSPTPTATPTETPYPEWNSPQPPNQPTEDKREEGRISRVTFVNTEPASDGDGYANFDLEVVADTRMENVDPPDHGDVRGEPYLLVEINGELFARTPTLPMEANGTFSVQIEKTGLDQFDAGALDVTVRLVDKDSEYDDIYGVRNATIRYEPD